MEAIPAPLMQLIFGEQTKQELKTRSHERAIGYTYERPRWLLPCTSTPIHYPAWPSINADDSIKFRTLSKQASIWLTKKEPQQIISALVYNNKHCSIRVLAAMKNSSTAAYDRQHHHD